MALSAVLLGSGLLPLPGADGRLAHIPAFCPFYQFTGLPCPGCGLTRAFVCLGHGHFWASLHWHPVGWIVYGVCVALWLRAGLTWTGRRSVWPVAGQTRGRLTAAALTGALLAGTGRILWLAATGGKF